MLVYRQGKTRAGRVGGFPEPERAVRGIPEAPRVLRGKSPFRACAVARKVLWARKNLPVRPKSCVIG